MKKILYLCLMVLFISELSIADTSSFNFKNRDEEFLMGFVEKNVNWFKKLETCRPAKAVYKTEYANLPVVIYGKTKNGSCHYADSLYYKGEVTPFQCVVPMQVAVALSTTARDSFDNNFEEMSPNIKEERRKQFLEMYRLAQDYCDYGPIIKKYGNTKNKTK